MPLYTVLAPPAGAGRPEPMDYVFVKDGVSWPALFIPELWLLFRRMWVVLLVYLAVLLLALATGRLVGGPLSPAFLTLAHLWFALEGNELRRWTLRRRGYRLVDVVQGGRLADAEMRFFLGLERAGASPPPAKPAITPPAVDEAGDVVGLFPTPGGGR